MKEACLLDEGVYAYTRVCRYGSRPPFLLIVRVRQRRETLLITLQKVTCPCSILHCIYTAGTLLSKRASVPCQSSDWRWPSKTMQTSLRWTFDESQALIRGGRLGLRGSKTSPYSKKSSTDAILASRGLDFAQRGKNHSRSTKSARLTQGPLVPPSRLHPHLC